MSCYCTALVTVDILNMASRFEEVKMVKTWLRAWTMNPPLLQAQPAKKPATVRQRNEGSGCSASGARQNLHPAPNLGGGLAFVFYVRAWQSIYFLAWASESLELRSQVLPDKIDCLEILNLIEGIF